MQTRFMIFKYLEAIIIIHHRITTIHLYVHLYSRVVFIVHGYLLLIENCLRAIIVTPVLLLSYAYIPGARRVYRISSESPAVQYSTTGGAHINLLRIVFKYVYGMYSHFFLSFFYFSFFFLFPFVSFKNKLPSFHRRRCSTACTRNFVILQICSAKRISENMTWPR